MTSDQSTRAQVDEALRTSRDEYRRMVDNSPMGMHFYELKEDDRLVFVGHNPAADRLLGVANAQFIGKTIEEAFPPFAQTEVPARYRDAAAHGISWSTEQVIYEHEQIKGAFEIQAFQTSFRHMVAVFIDLTHRKRIEDAVRSEKEKLAVTLKSIGDGVIATDEQGRVTLMNRVAEEMTGWSFDESRGRPLSEIFQIVNELTRKRCEIPVDRVLRTRETVELANHTVLISRNGDERIITDSGAPICDGNGRIIGVVLVFRDTTEKQKLIENIQRTQKLESIGVLAGGIAHDFNNLLGGIYGYLDMAKDTSSEAAVSGYLIKALNTLNRAKGLTEQLLTFAKGGTPIRKTCAVMPLMEQSARFVLSGSNVSCTYRVIPGLWLCDIDENRIGQVIDNIVINAQQAMPMGGTIEISAENLVISENAKVPLGKGNYVKISIRDSGLGIPYDILPRIFDPFFTTKQQGSGLGLATSYSIVQKHGGCIAVTSEPGKGSVFHVYLPASKQAGFADHLSPEKSDSNCGRILIMDDEEFIRDTLGNMLQWVGCEAVCAKDGQSALDILERETAAGRSFRAVILDLTVPGGMGGREVILHIRKSHPDIPVFVSSGYSEDPIIANPTRYGFTDSLSKPYNKEDVRKMLQRHLL